jgi:uncharacterized protein YjbI with pentapeptide repeats
MRSKKFQVFVGKQRKNIYDPEGLFTKVSEALAKGGVAGWNSKKRRLDACTKREHLNTGFADANFSGADLSGINLSGYFLKGCDFTGANLTKANFRNVQMWQAKFDNAILTNAKFSQSDLRYSTFTNAKLQNAWFGESNLTFANFEDAVLIGVDFSFANLGGANLKGADISGSNITGVSAWSIEVNKHTTQQDLIIEPWYDPLEKTVDNSHSAVVDDTFITNDIETAQLLYLLTSRNEDGKNEKVKTIVDAMTGKIVLILGRFSDNRIKTLNEIRSKLYRWGYVPVIFDFPKPNDRDLIETVGILAGLSRFVIADLTDPSSTPLEAMLIISAYCVPFAPIIEGNNSVFAMFDSLKVKYEWVLETWRYKNKKTLLADLKTHVVDRCEDMRVTMKKKAINNN